MPLRILNATSHAIAGFTLLLTLICSAQTTAPSEPATSGNSPQTGPSTSSGPNAPAPEVGRGKSDSISADIGLKVVPDCSVDIRSDKGKEHVKIGTSDWLQFGRPVTVCIDGLSRWRRKSSNDPTKIRLFLAGHMLNIVPCLIAPDSQNYVNFELGIGDSTQDRETWSYIIAEARASAKHSVPISVGWNDQPLESISYARVSLYPIVRALIFFPCLLVLALVLVYYGRKTDLLRDISFGASPSTGQLPFSLGRVQMAFWFFIIMTTFLYLWVITMSVPPLSAQALALLGISAGTGLGAAFIDQNSVSAQTTHLNALAVEKSALETRVNALQTLGPAQGTPVALELQSKKDRLAQVTADLLATPEITVPVTQGFIRDLMSESGEISFHRLQIAAWTIVLGAIFVVTCYSSIVMPSFDNTLLVLMGISSGTYLGFKLPSDKR